MYNVWYLVKHVEIEGEGGDIKDIKIFAHKQSAIKELNKMVAEIYENEVDEEDVMRKIEGDGYFYLVTYDGCRYRLLVKRAKIYE